MNNFFYFTFAALAMAILGCGRSPGEAAQLSQDGKSELGRQEILYYGCASCHVIPGVPGAQGLIGPPLKHFANRNYIAGVLKNSPDNLILWIEDAPESNPRTAMPNLQIPEDQARDIAAYLYTLK
jgi:mono/diheme cytochrome c family protein